MATDLRYQLLDEIALEGLDGITLNTLWVRLKERPDFKLELEDASKNYLWNCILSLKDVEYYELKEDRPDLVPYNRFHYYDPETGHFLETEHIPDDIYPVCVISDNGIRGSCATYETRKNVSEKVRDEEKRISLQEAMERYGKRLVLVASQDVRWRTLAGESSDPNLWITEVQYCILERIGRARYHGETAVGKLSLQAFKESTKTIFYFLKKLCRVCSIKKQGINFVKKPSNAKTHCQLFHLEKFYVELPQKSKYELYQVADYIDTFPDKMVEVSAVKAAFKKKDTVLKKLLQKTDNSGERLFEYIDVPYRQVYPNATPKEYLTKSNRVERSIRHVKMIKHPREMEEEDAAGSDDEEQEEETDEHVKFEQVYDKPSLAQMYDVIKSCGKDGICLTGLHKGLGLDKLRLRRQIKMLLHHGSITTILYHSGRQKRTVFVSKDIKEENLIHQTVVAEKKKFDRITSEKETNVTKSKKAPLEIKLNIEPPSDERKIEIKEELEKVDPFNQFFKKPLNPEQEKALALKLGSSSGDTFENVTIEESKFDEIVAENKIQKEKIGMEGFGCLTDSHIRRANWIIETVQAIKLLEQYQMRKLIRRREEEMGLQFMMDQKSLKRLVKALVEDKKVRSMKVTIQIGKKEKMFNYIADVNITPASDIVRRVIEESKLKHFSVSRDELRRSKKLSVSPPKPAPTPPPKKFSDSIPESAKQSIEEHQNYRKKLLQKSPIMKYIKMRGIVYGLLPKFLRAQKLHRVLWYFCYENYDKTLEPIEKKGTDKDDEEQKSMLVPSKYDKIDISEGGESASEIMKEPPVYVDELSWKRYLSTVPCHGYPKGWCFISDILLRLPVVTFCQIINICYDIEGLSDILNHPVHRFYPVKYLPFKVAQQLLYAKKYIYSFHDYCAVLCEMGLLTFGPSVMQDKEQTFIYLHSKASLLDTRDSLKGYNKTQAPPGVTFYRKTYELTTEENLNSYWDDLQFIALGSNMGFKTDNSDGENHEEYSISQALKRKTLATVEDIGRIPGDMRGAGGLDSSLFPHTRKNWATIKGKVRTKEVPHEEIPPPDQESIQRKQGEFATAIGEKSTKTKLTKNVQGNKGGRGVKRKLEQGRVVGSTEKKKRVALGKPAVQKKKILKKRRTEYERADELDLQILHGLTKQRVSWTAQEDSILLICKLAVALMGSTKTVFSYCAIRDILFEKCPEAYMKKTSMACCRRILNALKNPKSRQNFSLFYQEAMLDQYIIKEFTRKPWMASEEHFVVPKFRALVEYLLDKFQSLNVGKSELPEHLSQLQVVKVEPIGSLEKKNRFSDVASKTDICHDVLRNILHSSVLLHDKHGRSHEMFKLLTQYPDGLLAQVVEELRADGMLVHHKSTKSKLKPRLTEGIGLRNYKASQRYLYNYKQSYLSALFEESVQFLNRLSESYTGEESDQGLELDFNPKGLQAVILIPLILLRKIDIKVTMPEELVIIDLDSFYNFPWGRGKLCSKSEKFKQSEESLRELFPGTHLEKLKLPKESTPVTGFSVDKDDGAVHKLKKNAEAPNETDNSEANLALEPGLMEIDSVTDKKKGDSVKNLLTELSETDRTVDSVTVSPKVVSGSSVGKNQNDEISEEKKDDDINRSKIDRRKGGSDSVTGELDKAEGVKDKDKTVEETQEAPDVKYDLYKHGSSEMLLPQYEVVYRKQITEHLSAIASRTLLSVRRFDEEALEDIRIFNASDNFVVNSCAIRTKLRDAERENKDLCEKVVTVVEGSAEIELDDTLASITESNQIEAADFRSEPSTEQVEAMESAAIPEANEKGASKTVKSSNESGIELEVKKMKLLDTLLLKKEKTKQIWNNLLEILPFQLDIETVWEKLKASGMTEPEIVMCQQVYDFIEKARELGIRHYDLQKQFTVEFPWKRMVQSLIEQQALYMMSTIEKDLQRTCQSKEIDRK